MKKSMKKQYGDDWKNVYYATIRKKAMENEEELFQVLSYPDRWENALYNGSKFDLSKWSINFEMIEASMGNTDGARGHHMKKTSEKHQTKRYSNPSSIRECQQNYERR